MDNDINQEILAELRKLRRTSQWTSAISVLALVGVIVWAFVFVRRHEAGQASPWTEVSAAMRQYDYPKALQLTEALAAAHPDDYYPHSYLGYIYLEMGDLAQAETEYSRAYQLWPTEEMQKKLEAIQKRKAGDVFKTR
jgi:predicted Zn-dependent protease